MDLQSVLPDFSVRPFTHIIPSLERNHITTVDLVTLDPLEIAKRAHIPPADVRRLCADLIAALHRDLGFTPEGDEQRLVPGPTNRLDLTRWRTISTLDPVIDELLGGGIPTGYVTEVTGESASGKTQFLLTLLLAAQLPPPTGLGQKTIYISTEAPLATTRLTQLLHSHPSLSTLTPDTAPSLENVLSITAVDLETQDHILNYQLPVAVSRYNVGLLVIDSITANYRAEHSSNTMMGISARSRELARLGQMLRNLAVKHDLAVVVANQVSDRIDPLENSGPTSRLPPSTQEGVPSPSPRDPPASRVDGKLLESSQVLSSSPSPAPSSSFVEDDISFDGSYIIGQPVRNETLSLAHQERFFTGWGDSPPEAPISQQQSAKTPALGFVWSTQIACRIALKTANDSPALDEAGTVTRRRKMKLVFAPWTEGISRTSDQGSREESIHSEGAATEQRDAQSERPSEPPKHRPRPTDEIEFEIWKGGIRSVPVSRES